MESTDPMRRCSLACVCLVGVGQVAVLEREQHYKEQIRRGQYYLKSKHPCNYCPTVGGCMLRHMRSYDHFK